MKKMMLLIAMGILVAASGPAFSEEGGRSNELSPHVGEHGGNSEADDKISEATAKNCPGGKCFKNVTDGMAFDNPRTDIEKELELSKKKPDAAK